VSREDVELVREALVRNNPRQLADVEGMAALWHPDCEWTSGLTSFDRERTYRGLEGIIENHRDMAAAFEDWSVEPVEVVDAGGGTVVADCFFQARGRRSGVTLKRRVGAVMEVGAGRIRRTRTYTDPVRAYAAAGLPPPQRA
jgi:ketosteroid isomerase-like protein